MVGKGTSTQFMTSSHTYDVISTKGSVRKGVTILELSYLNWSPNKQEECCAGPQVKKLLFIYLFIYFKIK